MISAILVVGPRGGRGIEKGKIRWDGFTFPFHGWAMRALRVSPPYELQRLVFFPHRRKVRESKRV